MSPLFSWGSLGSGSQAFFIPLQPGKVKAPKRMATTSTYWVMYLKIPMIDVEILTASLLTYEKQ